MEPSLRNRQGPDLRMPFRGDAVPKGAEAVECACWSRRPGDAASVAGSTAWRIGSRGCRGVPGSSPPSPSSPPARGYGAVRGGHTDAVIEFLRDVRDMAANTVGFNIAAVALSGQHHLNREEILATAGVTGRASLLFFDVADARARLKTNPWIAEATVQKLLPDRLVISITEREPFALWQKAGRVGVIADDGTVLEPYVALPYSNLPLVVGAGAELRARKFLALLDRFPELRANVRASVLVADRRWNLWLRNGIDVRLPEFDVDKALDQLAALERDAKLSSRDITIIDLRLADRVTVQLSDAAAQARDEAAKKKQQKTKGGAA